MFELKVVLSESFNEETSEFEEEEVIELQLEHSLVSMSKWESKFEKIFLSKDDKTDEEVLEYIKMMILTEDYPENILEYFSDEQANQVNAYIKKKNSATYFREDNTKSVSREKVTTELIYYWMFSFQIPIEAETWNFNRLFNLIRIFSIKNGKQEKRSSKQIADERRALNDARKAKLKTKG